tara:strand:+ start:145 stop:705 length:561 start_codon:yes stop_codon:yes gene_type:complete
MSNSPLLQKNTTVLGKIPKPKSTLGKYVNDPLMGPDFSGDKNISGGELAADAAMSLIGGKLAGKALSKIGGGNIKRIGSKVSKFFNSYINPSSGKNIAKEAASIVAKKRATLKAGGVIPKGEFGYGKSQNFANAAKAAKETEYTSIDKGPSNWILTSMKKKPTEYKSIYKGKTNREGYFGMHNKNK